MKSGNEADAHGAILLVGSLLRHSGNFLMPRFIEVCDAVMSLKESSSR
ncbi:unnamed protein product [Choristocarpus tenellus]